MISIINAFTMPVYKYLFFLWLPFICVASVHADDFSALKPSAGGPGFSTEKTSQFSTLVSKRLATYNSEFPEIFFVHIPYHGEWIESIIALELLLGYKATSLDFEHPEELSDDLLYMTVRRFKKMLLHGHSAAFLFRAGAQSFVKQNNICVITMNAQSIASSSEAANDYMLALSSETLGSIPGIYQLDGVQLLEFIVDHEAGHCLDSYFNQPVPMSKKNYWGHYMSYKREIFADTFAMARHISQYGDGNQFINNFIRFRKLCLLNGDPGACSADALLDLVLNNIHKISNKSIDELIQLTMDLRSTDKFGYDQYVNYLFASIKAIQLLEVDKNEKYNELEKTDQHLLDKHLVFNLIYASKSSYRFLFGTELEVKALD